MMNKKVRAEVDDVCGAEIYSARALAQPRDIAGQDDLHSALRRAQA